MTPRRVLSVFITLALAGAAGEVGVRLWADSADASPIFQTDPRLGWRGRPDLEGTRKNPDGSTWDVRTDAAGFRPPANEGDPSKSTILFMGDSFVFGQTVQLKDRFDSQLQADAEAPRVLNRGISGYSTDQELLAAEEDLRVLQKPDAAVLLTFGDDFGPLLQERYAGRPKPRFIERNSKLVEIPPALGARERLEDDLWSVAAIRHFFPSKIPIPSGQDLERALFLYGKLVTLYLAPAAERGVTVVIAFHGHPAVETWFGPGSGEKVEAFLQNLCKEKGFRYLSLAASFKDGDDSRSDGLHWNAAGHRKFAEDLRKVLVS